jgi:hypothetical protein
MAEKRAAQMNEAVAAMKTAITQTVVNLTAIIDDAYTPTPPRTISLPMVFKKGFGKNVVDTWLVDVGIRQLYVVRSKLTALLGDVESNKIDNAVFFEQLSAIYGETIDYLNYKTYEAKIQSVTTLIKLNIPFFSYSLNVLKNVQSNLNVIQSFNPSQRVTKSFSANSAREEFAQRGLFTALTDIHNTTKAANLVEDKRYNLMYLSDIVYPEVKPGDDLTQPNKEYLGKLQAVLKSHFENHQYTPSRPEEISVEANPVEAITGGAGPITVLIENIKNTLSTEFGMLCAAISDIASHYYGSGNQMGGNQMGGDDTKPGEEPQKQSDAMEVVVDQPQQQTESLKPVEPLQQQSQTEPGPLNQSDAMEVVEQQTEPLQPGPLQTEPLQQQSDAMEIAEQQTGPLQTEPLQTEPLQQQSDAMEITEQQTGPLQTEPEQPVVAPVSAPAPNSRQLSRAEPTPEIDENQTRVEDTNRNRIKSILMQPITPEDKYLLERAIMDYLESSQYAIMTVYEWASVNNVSIEDNREFAAVRLNYLYVYALFSALLNDPNVILSNLGETPESVAGLFENIANQNNPNPQIWPIAFIYKGLFGENSIYSEYCVNTQTGVHFKERSGFNAENLFSMVQQCIKIRYLGITKPDNTTETVDPFNVILAVFLFFQNYFKYVILRKIETETQTAVDTASTDYSQYGYYPGYLEGFNRTEDATVLLKILELLPGNVGGISTNISADSMTYESDQYQHIYSNFSHITFRLLLFIRDEKKSASAAKVAKQLKYGGIRKTAKRRSRRNKQYSNRRFRYPTRVQKTARRRAGRRATNRKQLRSTS